MSDKSGFDIVIGNPPYLGEKKNKISFLPVQKSSLGKYYLGRMDYFYFFFHLSLDIMKEKGVSTFITTNYYPTALGGKKLRTELKNKSTLIEIVNFNETKIFDSAAGQHNMITTYSRALKDIKCRVKTSNKIGSITATELSVFLNGNYPYSIVNYILNSELWDGPENYLRFLGINAKSSNINIVLEKIISKSTALLGDLCTPLIGLKSSLDSVFVLDRNKVDEVTKLNKKDESLFKPFFKNSDIKKYHIKSNTNKYILYLHEKINDIESYDGVWSYLLKNEKSIKDRKDANLKGAYKSGNWWVLSTPRLDMNFNEEKIVTPYRSKLPCFAFAAKEWYASNDVYYIINKKGTVGLKYVLGLLNSKLYYVWHYNRGKRKGNTLEMYAKPLKEIPIYEAPVEVQTKYFILVDEIIKLKKIDPDIDTNHLETQIDILTYRLYDLTYDEVKSIDKEFILSLEEYNAFIL
jgi:adenine-specific DNA-methyltransferase